MWKVLFTPDALRQFKKLPKAVRPMIKEAVRVQLVQGNPERQTRNKFRLRRISPFADYELRAGSWRVFYRVEPDAVVVTLLGEKRGSKLVVEGEELRI